VQPFTSTGRAPLPATTPDGRIWSYAGFWWRVLAFILDSLLLWLVDFAIAAASGWHSLTFGTDTDSVQAVADVAWHPGLADVAGPHWYSTSHWHGGGLTLAVSLLSALYFILLESSKLQGTLGKRACGLRVTGLHGQRISVLRALGRHLAKILSGLLFGIGFLMVGWTRHKQALHDKLAGTLVMRLRPADTVFAFRAPDER